eukprot:gnl/MRDRNA2_/MRDRNA2_77932_c0_seq1.p1 gnl/MRDRNA2_/MRDRNA2_77932_c0~~gnl/MRDRNA2_/MRDRNA2_77932_c0_seq1.p1  ORF type:complete len:167 (+),score=13.11 gnl/MRDRNA2_/MRDRNA2_77932_c0_seq1:53-502(+)
MTREAPTCSRALFATPSGPRPSAASKNVHLTSSPKDSSTKTIITYHHLEFVRPCETQRAQGHVGFACNFKNATTYPGNACARHHHVLAIPWLHNWPHYQKECRHSLPENAYHRDNTSVAHHVLLERCCGSSSVVYNFGEHAAVECKSHP